ncbi:MAG TPA: hypothetical protein V6C76_04485 [Drouetiella sp.]
MQKQRIVLTLLASTLCLGASWNLCGFAATAGSEASTTSKKTSTTTTTAKTTSAPSSVTATTPDRNAIEEQLRDLRDTLKRTYNAASSIQLECSRAYNADAIDDEIMDPWMAGQPGLRNALPPPFPDALKPLPARKKWIDNDQAQITQLLKTLTAEINTVSTAASLDTDLKVSSEIMLDNLHQVDSQYSQLVSLTNTTAVDERGQPAYDKIGIARAAQGLKDETSGLNEIRKRMIRQLKSVKK